MADSNQDDKHPIDMDTLNANFMQNQDIIKQILAAFKESFVDFESQFRDYESAGDTESMSRLAHSLKGSAGNITALALADQAADLQHQIDDGAEKTTIDSSIDSLLTSLDDLNTYIDDIL